MRSFLDATDSFWHSLSDITWSALGLAIGCHLLKLCCTGRAWRNVLAAAYPEEKVRWRQIFAAYVSGVGINAIIPARAGDVVRVVLAHRAIQGSSYTTVVTSNAVLAVFDMTFASLLFAWALTQNVLPSVHVLPSLPTFDYGWFLDHRRFSIVAGVVLLVLVVVGLFWVHPRWREFRGHVAQAFSVMSPFSRYLRTVVFWQLCDWSLRLTAIWFFLGAFRIDQNVHNVLLVQATQSLAGLVPATPGGIGTEQAFILYAFRDAGIARSTLLAFSVGVRLTLTVVNVIVGFTALFLTLGTLRYKSAVPPPSGPEPMPP